MVDFYVTSKSPGAYILSRDGRTANYVGRSDTDVGSRIKQSVAQGYYTHYWFEYATSPRIAYIKECEYYNKYKPLDNTNYPAVPEYTYLRDVL